MTQQGEDTGELRGRVDALEKTVAALQARVAALEPAAQPALTGAAPPAAPIAPLPTPETRETPDEQPLVPQPARQAVAADVLDERERTLAGRWALLAGAVALFLAAAFFLGAQWNSIPAIFKPLLGFLVGAGLLKGAQLGQSRLQPWAREGLIGTGMGLFYWSVWGAFDPLHLIGAIPALLGVLGLTAWAGFLARRFEAKSLLAVAWLGAYMAPSLAVEAVPLAVYALVLAAGVLPFAVRWRQPQVLWGTWFGTALLLAPLPYQGLNAPPALWGAAGVATLMFLLAGAAWSLRVEKSQKPHDGGIVVSSALLWSLVLTAVRPIDHDLVMGSSVLGAGFLLALLALWRAREVPPNPIFCRLLALVALGFLTWALAIAFDGAALVMAWTVETTLLALVAQRWGGSDMVTVVRMLGVLTALSLWIYLTNSAPGAAAHRPWVLAGCALGAGTVVLAAHRRSGAVGWGSAWASFTSLGLLWCLDGAHLSFTTEDFWSATFQILAGRLGLAMLGLGVLAGLYGGLAKQWRDRQLLIPAEVGWVLAALGSCTAASVALFKPPVPYIWLAAFANFGVGWWLAWLLRVPFAEVVSAGERLQIRLALGFYAIAVTGLLSYNLTLSWVAISVAWLAVGAAMVLVGLRLSALVYRRLGFGLLALTALKVLLTDTAEMGVMGRVAVFAVIGVVFIGIALMYGRKGPREEVG